MKVRLLTPPSHRPFVLGVVICALGLLPGCGTTGHSRVPGLSARDAEVPAALADAVRRDPFPTAAQVGL